MDIIAQTASGPIGGVLTRGVARYLGVPYAAAPVGDLRFAAPQAHLGWSEVRDSTQPGPSAPYLLKDFDGLDLAPLVGDGWVRGDEYLNTNIWAPVGGDGRPVMVWIHGGAWTGGAAIVICSPENSSSGCSREWGRINHHRTLVLAG